MPLITKVVSRRSGKWREISASGVLPIRLPAEEVPLTVETGREIDAGQWRELELLSRYTLLRETALRMLGRRDHFQNELRQKLRQREPDAALVARVIEYCQTQGYLDDDKALRWAVERLQHKGGIGQARVKAELFRLGCPAELVPLGLELFSSGQDTPAELQQAVERKRSHFATRLEQLLRKTGTANLPANRELKQVRFQLKSAVYAYLSGRGFDSESCAGAAEQLVAELLDEDRQV